MAQHEHVERQEMVPGSETEWIPGVTLAMLAFFFLAACALAGYLIASGGEPFAVGLAIYAAVVMAVGALLGFGPIRRV